MPRLMLVLRSSTRRSRARESLRVRARSNDGERLVLRLLVVELSSSRRSRARDILRACARSAAVHLLLLAVRCITLPRACFERECALAVRPIFAYGESIAADSALTLGGAGAGCGAGAGFGSCIDGVDGLAVPSTTSSTCSEGKTRDTRSRYCLERACAIGFSRRSSSCNAGAADAKASSAAKASIRLPRRNSCLRLGKL